MAFATLVGVTTQTMYVPVTAGSPIPIQMPSGIQAGDELIVHMENWVVNPVDISGGPPGWQGALSTGWFTKTADGSEDGAVLTWYTQSTTGAFHHARQRVLVCAALAYRFTIAPNFISRFFQDFPTGVSSTTLTNIPGTGGSAGTVTNTELRVYCAFGRRADDPSDPASGHPISGYTWTNPTDRTGLVALEWNPGDENNLNDGTGMTVADVEYELRPGQPGYQPGDAVTLFGGAFDTGGTLHTVVYNIPAIFPPVAYWGINATTPA